MGFFGFDTKKTDASQKLTDQRVSATEGSLVPYGAGSTAAGGSVFSAQDKSTLNLTDRSNTIYNDPEIFLKGLAANADLSESALEEQNKLADKFLEAYQEKEGTLRAVLESNASLAADAATGGEAGRNKALLIVTLAVLALVGWIFWQR